MSTGDRGRNQSSSRNFATHFAFLGRKLPLAQTHGGNITNVPALPLLLWWIESGQPQ